MIAAKPFLAEGKQEGKNMERTNKLWILDSTLRDGAQGENISFSVQDKLRIVSALDQLGIDYIEAGNPASNPKDLEFFERVRALPLRHARLAAFGSTRRKDARRGQRGPARPAAGKHPRRLHLWQELGLSRHPHPAHDAGGEPADDRAERRLSQGKRPGGHL